MNKQTEKPANANDAIATVEETPQTALEMQQEVWNWWSLAMDPLGLLQRSQNRLIDSQSNVESSAPAVEKEMEEVIEIEDKSAFGKSELVGAEKSAPEFTVLPRGFVGPLDLWKLSMDMMKSNTEALIQINGQILAFWMGMLPKR